MINKGGEEHLSYIKNQEKFDSYSLPNLYNISKAHEAQVKEIVDDTDKTNFGGTLALISETNINEASYDVKDDENEEGLIMNYNDDVVAYYSNNNNKKIYKKPIKGNFKSNTFKKVAQTSNLVIEKKKDGNATEQKVEKKLAGDSRYDFNYCNGKNHLARDCMFKKKEEKQVKVKDEAYYDMKIEELGAKSKNISLLAKG